MEIVWLSVFVVLLCLCGVLCSQLYWANKLIDALEKCCDKKDELLDKQREYIAVLEKVSGIDFNEVEVK